LQNVYRTADRAGFVLADSLEVAAQIITREGHSRPQIHPKERIRDVVAFSVSEAYFELRSELGFDR
jgi:hypothetical protein